MDQLSARSVLATQADVGVRPPLQVGSATLIEELRELRTGATTTRLEPLVVKVLIALADAHGRTVSRAELFQSCWYGAIVDESALNRVIAQIRRASRRAGNPFTVQTVPKLGYRLTSEKTDLRGQVLLSPGTTRRTLLLTGSGALSALAAGVWLLPDRRATNAQAIELERRAQVALADMLPARDQEAIALLTEAASLHPQRSSIWGTLAMAHQRVAELGAPEVASQAAARVADAAKQSLTLDGNNADALVAMTLNNPVYRRWLEAERDYAAMVRRFPNHASLLAGYAKLLAEVGRLNEAMRLFSRVFELEPLGPGWHWRRGMGLWAAGRPGEARQLLDRALRIWPSHPSIWTASFWVSAYSGDLQRSRTLLGLAVAATVRRNQRALMQRSAEAMASADPAIHRAAIRANRADATQSTSAAEHAMAVAANLGDHEEALAIARAYHFGEGFEVGDARLESGANLPPDRRKTLTLFWPPLATLRRTEEFRALTQEIGLEGYWRESGKRPDFATA